MPTLFEWTGKPAGGTKGIALATRLGTPIENTQEHEISKQEAMDYAELMKKYQPPLATCRSKPDPVYNCHGFTFASRRTRVWEPAMVAMVLAEDSYVPQSSPVAGDVAVYFGPDGDIQHSGIVLAVGTPETLGLALVCSKWGSGAEVLHLATNCPYMEPGTEIKYYRISP